MEPLNIPNKIRVIINDIQIMRIRNMTTKENNNKKRGAKLEVFFKLGARTRKRKNDIWRDKTLIICFASYLTNERPEREYIRPEIFTREFN